MDRQEHAVADVEHSSVWGVAVAVLGCLALVGLIMLVGRRYVGIAIPVALVIIAFVVARRGKPNSS